MWTWLSGVPAKRFFVVPFQPNQRSAKSAGQFAERPSQPACQYPVRSLKTRRKSMRIKELAYLRYGELRIATAPQLPAL
jgi:hypothetical protein